MSTLRHANLIQTRLSLSLALPGKLPPRISMAFLADEPQNTPPLFKEALCLDVLAFQPEQIASWGSPLLLLQLRASPFNLGIVVKAGEEEEEEAARGRSSKHSRQNNFSAIQFPAMRPARRRRDIIARRKLIPAILLPSPPPAACPI